jgi:uncharacterized protein YigE (DUF2233 family)
MQNCISPKCYASLLTVIFFLSSGNCAFSQENSPVDNRIVSYIVDPETQDVAFYWKNDTGEIIGSFRDLKRYVERKNSSLVFATNGGMFKPDYSPVGLYIEKKRVLESLKTGSGSGNFNLKPNGVFYLDIHNKPGICQTDDFKKGNSINYATQSGPMLLIDGKIHPAFREGSENLNIRNGVGILPDRKIVFAISTEGINFYDFAGFFKNLGCEQALYLDGAISEIYLPEKGFNDTGGYFGVLIGVIKPENK